MTTSPDPERGLHLARVYFDRVWSPPHDLGALDGIVTPDFRLHSAGLEVVGREAFKRWVAQAQSLIGDVRNAHLELFADVTGERVVSRWVSRGRNLGMFGSPPDGRPVEYTGLSLWRMRGGLFSELWAERSALELRERLRG